MEHNLEASQNNTNSLILKRVIEGDHNPTPVLSVFDKYVNQEELRALAFSDDSDIMKNNPGYKLRTERLLGNSELIGLLLNDSKLALTDLDIKDPTEALNADKLQAYRFSEVNVIGEDFLIETQMFNVGYSGNDKKPIALIGFGFMYLCDCVSGKKLFLGSIKLLKKPKDTRLKINIAVNHELYTLLTKDIKHPVGAVLFSSEHMTNLQNTLLKNSSGYSAKMTGYKLNSAKGKQSLLTDVIKDMKSLSPNLIDVICLVDIKKVIC